MRRGGRFSRPATLLIVITGLEAIARACLHLERGESSLAARTLEKDYPFEAPVQSGRSYTPRQMTQVFLRDGFIDRYSGQRLVFPAVLRVLSLELPNQLPMHKNWKMAETHIAYWDLFPTIDHLVPVARGGADDESNWVTASMSRNAAKGSSTLEQLGWELRGPGRLAEWDGQSAWLLRYLDEKPHLRVGYVKTWANALASQFEI